MIKFSGLLLERESGWARVNLPKQAPSAKREAEKLGRQPPSAQREAGVLFRERAARAILLGCGSCVKLLYLPACFYI
jgi:hypothetical protein